MPIELLKRVIVNETEDGIQTTKLPSSESMMNKINEIINTVNHLERNDFKRSFDEDDTFKPRICR